MEALVKKIPFSFTNSSRSFFLCPLYRILSDFIVELPSSFLCISLEPRMGCRLLCSFYMPCDKAAAAAAFSALLFARPWSSLKLESRDTHVENIGIYRYIGIYQNIGNTCDTRKMKTVFKKNRENCLTTTQPPQQLRTALAREHRSALLCAPSYLRTVSRPIIFTAACQSQTKAMSNSRKRGASSLGGGGRSETRQRSTAAPTFNAIACERKYLGWETHVTDLCNRQLFKRFYRISEEAFEDLADLLGPAVMIYQHYY